MERKPISPDLNLFPQVFHPLLLPGRVYDSSCSREAQVWFLDVDGGLYLKSAPAGALRREGEMTRYFHTKGLGAEVLRQESLERDWLLTRRIPGEDCTHKAYLQQPGRLCDTLAELLRQLHETPFSGCPIADRCGEYLADAEKGRKLGLYEKDLFHSGWGFSSEEEAWQVVQSNASALKNDTLIHGDYCLPNTLLDSWRFSGFIDLDGAGVGDRHIDVFWGIWTFFFNLGTNAYTQRFLDAYGRDAIEPELLRTVAALETFR